MSLSFPIESTFRSQERGAFDMSVQHHHPLEKVVLLFDQGGWGFLRGSSKSRLKSVDRREIGRGCLTSDISLARVIHGDAVGEDVVVTAPPRGMLSRLGPSQSR